MSESKNRSVRMDDETWETVQGLGGASYIRKAISDQIRGEKDEPNGAEPPEDPNAVDLEESVELVNTEVQPPSIKEIGVTGLRHSGGVILEEFHPKLTSGQSVEVYAEMVANSPTIRGALRAIQMLMLQAPWRVLPGDPDEPRSVEAAEFVQTALDDMSHDMGHLLTNVMSMLTYGWSYHEIVYKRREGSQPTPGTSSKFDDGKVGWRKFPIRSQDSLRKWEIAKDGNLKGMWQYLFYDRRERSERSVMIPLEKALLFRPEAYKDSPEGESVLRSAYRPYHMAKRIEEIEAIGIERDLAGLPVLRIPGGSSHPAADAWEKMIRNVRRGEQHGIILPSEVQDGSADRPQYDMELLNSGGDRQLETGAVVGRYHREEARSMLADWMFLGEQSVGSFALADSKTTIFSVAIGAWMDNISSVFNRHAIPRLLRLNGIELDTPPVLGHGDIEKPDLLALGNFISKLAAAGMPLFPDPDIENIFRSLIGVDDLTPNQQTERRSEIEEEKQRTKDREDQMFAMTQMQQNDQGELDLNDGDPDNPANQEQNNQKNQKNNPPKGVGS